MIGWLFARQTAEISMPVDTTALHARLDRPFDVDELAAELDNETAPGRAPVTGGRTVL